MIQNDEESTRDRLSEASSYSQYEAIIREHLLSTYRDRDRYQIVDQFTKEVHKDPLGWMQFVDIELVANKFTVFVLQQRFSQEETQS